MRRKQFLSSFAKASVLLSITPSSIAIEPKKNWRIPAFLQKGDTIGITSPAGAITLSEIQPEDLLRFGFYEWKCRVR